ncbi:MAG: LPP20 family lipoprotein, partial [Phycisphaerae bacterium]
WMRIGPQERFLAERGARIDAMRKLLERIQGLRINSETQVRDFVVETDTIHAVAQGTLTGAKEVRTYFHADEPIVEVTVEVPVEQVISFIRELSSKSIQGDRVKGMDVTEITRAIEKQVFQATGMGVPSANALRQFNRLAQNPADRVPPWAMQPIRATGQAVSPPDKAGTPQGKLLAARGAEQDAKRRLAEQIHGLKISSNTTVKDFVTRQDEIRAQVDAVLLGAAVEKTSFDGDTATVVVMIPGMAVWDVVHDQLRGGTGQGADAGPGAAAPVGTAARSPGAVPPAAPPREEAAPPPAPHPPPPPPGEKDDGDR